MLFLQVLLTFPPQTASVRRTVPTQCQTPPPTTATPSLRPLPSRQSSITRPSHLSVAATPTGRLCGRGIKPALQPEIVSSLCGLALLTFTLVLLKLSG